MNPDHKIIVTIRDIYGRETIYPACDNAKRFVALTGKKTLDERDLKIIRELGYRVFVQPRNLAAVGAGREI